MPLLYASPSYLKTMCPFEKSAARILSHRVIRGSRLLIFPNGQPLRNENRGPGTALLNTRAMMLMMVDKTRGFPRLVRYRHISQAPTLIQLQPRAIRGLPTAAVSVAGSVVSGSQTSAIQYLNGTQMMKMTSPIAPHSITVQ